MSLKRFQLLHELCRSSLCLIFFAAAALRFDFLIGELNSSASLESRNLMLEISSDIIPREEATAAQQQDDSRASSSAPSRKGKGKAKATGQKRGRQALADAEDDENLSESGSARSGAHGADGESEGVKRARFEGDNDQVGPLP